MPSAYEMVRRAGGFGTTERIAELEAEVERLRAEVEELRKLNHEVVQDEIEWRNKAGDRLARIEAALAIPEPELDPYGDGPVGGGGTDFISGWRAHQRATVEALKGGGDE